MKIEDMIANEEMVVTISHLGYIKRTLLSEYKIQKRGGIGSRGSSTRDEDFIEHLFVANMHNYMLFFTQKGKCFWLRVFEIPEGNRYSKGRPIQNLINIDPGDKVKAYINVKSLEDKDYINNNYIVFCTLKGIVKKTLLEEYSRPRQSGIIAINVREGDELLQAKLTNGRNEIMIALKSGRAIRFNEEKVRAMGRSASGVRAIRLSDEANDEVIGMVAVGSDEETILVVSENGYGKRSKLSDYRITNRGGKGVKTINITEKTGKLIAIKNVNDNDDLMIINKSGIVIRILVNTIRVLRRATQGVRLINLKNGDSIAAVAKVENESDELVENENIPLDMSAVGDQSVDNTIVEEDNDEDKEDNINEEENNEMEDEK